jgi:hypothetical protein
VLLEGHCVPVVQSSFKQSRKEEKKIRRKEEKKKRRKEEN